MTTRISEYLDAVHHLSGLRLRAVLDDHETRLVLHDSLEGDRGGDLTEEAWPLSPTSTLRVTLAGLGDGRAQTSVPLLRESLARLAASEEDARFYGAELAERYQEISLLTSIGETLGSVVNPERAAVRLLERVVEVMEADVVALWVPDPAEAQLGLLAAAGSTASAPPGVPLRGELSPLAKVYLSQTNLVAHGWPGAAGGGADRAFLAVPARHSALHGSSRAVGVLALRARCGRRDFSQGDVKLAAAIAGQLAAAIENGRLVRESLEQERLLVELELAHHLQLKLLPDLEDFRALADVAARCEPAESVGGDFYHLFRLSGESLGVMLGDVSSHGYSAGLIMALTMSAASIMVREREQPADVLRGIHHELVRKLETTEMYMTLCYAVIDFRHGLLRYANAGHPHAYRIGAEGTLRLEALNPPLGIAEFDAYAQRDVEWRSGQDTLLLFTDGISECLRVDQLWSDEQLTAIVRDSAAEGSQEVLDRLFRLACAPGGVAADDRTALVVK